MDEIFFHKMQGAGNDFVVLDHLEHPEHSKLDHSRLAERLCARHFGVGADGLLTLESPSDRGLEAGAAVRMRMWNPDGTEDMCGNGLRCVAALAWRQGHAPGRRFAVETLSGPRAMEILEGNQVRAEMGEPHFAPAAIPMTPPGTWTEALNYTLPIEGQEFVNTSSLSTGSTHTVIFGDELPPETEFLRLSPLLEHHPWFPERTTILWTAPAGPDHFRVRIWERGVGETLACGTGASAVAVAAKATGRARGTVSVESRGGVLRVEWEPGQSIHLTGPAEILFQAKWLASESRTSSEKAGSPRESQISAL
jgi:diaminopimelate epimerase